MVLRFVRKNPPITRKGIASFEESVDIKLPADYVNFLLETNGGQLEYYQYAVTDELDISRSPFMLDMVYGLETPTVQLELDGLRYKNRVSRKIDNGFPFCFIEIIACADGHHRIVLSTCEKDYGFVYGWSGEAPFSFDEDVLIATSFQEFLTTKVQLEDENTRNERIREFWQTLRNKNKNSE